MTDSADLLRMLMYGVSAWGDPLPHVDESIRQFLGEPVDRRVAERVLDAIRDALASDVDLSEHLGQTSSDPVVRRFLGAVQARLLAL